MFVKARSGRLVNVFHYDEIYIDADPDYDEIYVVLAEKSVPPGYSMRAVLWTGDLDSCTARLAHMAWALKKGVRFLDLAKSGKPPDVSGAEPGPTERGQAMTETDPGDVPETPDNVEKTRETETHETVTEGTGESTPDDGTKSSGRDPE